MGEVGLISVIPSHPPPLLHPGSQESNWSRGSKQSEGMGNFWCFPPSLTSVIRKEGTQGRRKAGRSWGKKGCYSLWYHRHHKQHLFLFRQHPSYLLSTSQVLGPASELGIQH